MILLKPSPVQFIYRSTGHPIQCVINKLNRKELSINELIYHKNKVDIYISKSINIEL